MNFFFVFVFLTTYLSYIFVLDTSIFTVTDDNKEKKKIKVLQVFLKDFLLKFEEIILQIHKHLTLDNLNTQKIKLHTNP